VAVACDIDDIATLLEIFRNQRGGLRVILDA
jgi:hypothetical protein